MRTGEISSSELGANPGIGGISSSGFDGFLEGFSNLAVGLDLLPYKENIPLFFFTSDD